MISNTNGYVLNSATNFEILNTHSTFDFNPKSEENFANASLSHETHLNWIYTKTPFEKRSLQVSSTNTKIEDLKNRSVSKIKKRAFKKKQQRSKKNKNCVIKMFKKNRRRIKRDKSKMQGKYVVPFILGLLAAKSLLIPVALKVLAFISAKGLMLGFFSTALASLLSLKAVFDHSHGYKERKDNTKTHVEIIQIPSRKEDHIHYDKNYNKGNYVPFVY